MEREKKEKKAEVEEEEEDERVVMGGEAGREEIVEGREGRIRR